MLYPVALAEAGWPDPIRIQRKRGAGCRPRWCTRAESSSRPGCTEYLLDPYPIRPAARLRMPKFHLSSSEAAELTDYFAAESAGDFPYHSDPRGRLARWVEEPAGQIRSQSKAMGFLVDRTTDCGRNVICWKITAPGAI